MHEAGVDVDAATVEPLGDGHSTVKNVFDSRRNGALDQGFHVAAEYDPWFCLTPCPSV